MNGKRGLYLGVATAALLAVLAGVPTQVRAQQTAAVSIGDTDLGGVVRGPNGPEAGVWVIAETNDLPTRMVKIVVTDDQGRYVMPALPKANYTVWVRGYGLVDSPKITTTPGKIVNLTAVPAPNEAAAAEILSAGVLAFVAQRAEPERIPRYRERRQRHQPENEVAAAIPARIQDRWLLPLSRHRHQGDAYAVAAAG